MEEPAPWAQVRDLYDVLLTYRDDAVVRLNRAAALAETAGPDAAMREIDALDVRSLIDFLPYQALRADVLQRVGRIQEARDAYDAALGLAPGPAERLWLERRKAYLGGVTGEPSEPKPPLIGVPGAGVPLSPGCPIGVPGTAPCAGTPAPAACASLAAS